MVKKKWTIWWGVDFLKPLNQYLVSDRSAHNQGRVSEAVRYSCAHRFILDETACFECARRAMRAEAVRVR